MLDYLQTQHDGKPPITAGQIVVGGTLGKLQFRIGRPRLSDPLHGRIDARHIPAAPGHRVRHPADANLPATRAQD